MSHSFSALPAAKLTSQFPSQTNLRKIPSLCLSTPLRYKTFKSREHDASVHS